MVLSSPAVLIDNPVWAEALGLSALIALGISWRYSYQRVRSRFAADVGDAVALTALGLACRPAVAVLGIAFAAIWFHSAYGSGTRAYLRCSLYLLALLVVVPLRPVMPARAQAPVGVAAILGAAPIMFLTVAIGRELWKNVRARDAGAKCDAALASLGTRLIGITDPLIIMDLAWKACRAVSEAMPELRILHVVDIGGMPRVEWALGAYPRSVAERGPSEACAEAYHLADDHKVPVDHAAGPACHWTSLPLYGSATARLVLGSPRPGDGLVALQTLTSQVNLALRNSTIQRELIEQATRDPLTKLLNRAAFGDAIETALLDNGNMPLSVLFLDLDNFKIINDTFGHHLGDAVLCEVAQRLRGSARSDDKCARLGGDEFAVLLVRADEATAFAFAERITKALVVPAVLGGTTVSIRASIGTATTQEADLPDILLRNADVAMYAAKARGQGNVVAFKTSLFR